jgi:long-chain acyl-CoA synthetase
MSSPFADRPWLSSYAEGVPADIEPPTTTLTEAIEQSVRKHGRRTALEFFGAETSFSELGESIDRAAEGLRRLGVKKGDRVAIVLPNCPQHVIAFYAALRLGAVVVEHNPLYTARELRHQFEDHGAKVVIAWNKVVDIVRDFPADIRVESIVAVDLVEAMPFRLRLALGLPIRPAREKRAAITTKLKGGGYLEWAKLLDHRRISSRHERPGVDDLAVLLYTSGTTGTPKGVMLTHSNLRANAEQGRAWVPGLREGRETFYAVLPMFHAYGLTLCLTFAMSIGARLVLFPRFDLDLVLSAAKRTPPTFLPAVPPVYERLARAARDGNKTLRGIRFAISGAMSLPVATVERWEDAIGGYLVEGYGMTESSPVAIGNPIGASRRPGTVGVPFPSTHIRVIDEHGADVGPDTPGELLLKGPQVFTGYWNRPDETAETLLPGGWLRTGDIVVVSADGFVRVVDRLKELIITGGFNVAPSEVEEVLLGHPDVAEVAVVGLNGNSGEQVAAAVVLRKGAKFNEDSVRDFAKQTLAAYKVPRRVIVVEDLPRSLIGKVLRREVRDLF